MKKVVAVLSLIVGAKCTWEDPFLTVSDSTKFIFTPDRDVAGKIIIPESPVTGPNEALATLNYDALKITLECVKDWSVINLERCERIVRVTEKDIRLADEAID